MEIAVFVLTTVLVLITGYYAWQTRTMASEMQEARLHTATPHVILDLEMVTPLYAMIVVENVGPGPALLCDLELTLTGGEAEEHRQWRPHLLPAGVRHEFLPPENVGSLDTLADAYPNVALRGHARDTLGRSHEVHATLDVTAAREGLRETRHRFQRPAGDRVVKELEKIAKQLDDIERHLRQRPGFSDV